MDAAKFPAYAGVSPSQNNGNYRKDKIIYTADKMPYSTNAFPSAVALVNRQDSTRQVANNGAVAINIDKIEDKSAPFAHIFIDDAEELRLQTFTLEFFARIPDTTLGSRCIVARCGS